MTLNVPDEALASLHLLAHSQDTLSFTSPVSTANCHGLGEGNVYQAGVRQECRRLIQVFDGCADVHRSAQRAQADALLTWTPSAKSSSSSCPAARL